MYRVVLVSGVRQSDSALAYVTRCMSRQVHPCNPSGFVFM